MMPTPRPRIITSSSTAGTASTHRFICTVPYSWPKKKNHAQKTKNISIWMPRFTSEMSTWEMGMVSRGKYTLPNRPALDTKVLAVPVMQAEKKDQMALPAI